MGCCILAENCDEANYVRLIEALCVEHQIPILKIGDNKTLGEWSGLCKIDREGNAVKVVGCSYVVVREVDDNAAWDYLQTHLKKMPARSSVAHTSSSVRSMITPPGTTCRLT